MKIRTPRNLTDYTTAEIAAQGLEAMAKRLRDGDECGEGAVKAESELSKTMKACMDFTRGNAGEIKRFPGGFWGTMGNGQPWFGTTTVEALVNRGFLEYSEWRRDSVRPFPIAAKLRA